MRRCVECGTALGGESWACPACAFAPESRDGVPYLAPQALAAGGGFEPSAFARLAELEEGSFWFRARNELVLWALNRWFRDAESLLEVGCGTGFVLAGVRAARPQMRLAGAELYPHALGFTRARVPDAELLQLDATRMPYDAEWDVAGAFDVLEHIEDDEAALAGLVRAVRPGGGVLITVPQHPSLWSAADDYAHHCRRYTRRELVGRARAAGVDVLRTTSFVTLLLPAMYASRWLERRSDTAYDPVREHLSAARVPLLKRVLDLERAVIRRGAALPVGGSLLLVGRRR
jgi:SAM-dependent methyltransferase